MPLELTVSSTATLLQDLNTISRACANFLPISFQLEIPPTYRGNSAVRSNVTVGASGIVVTPALIPAFLEVVNRDRGWGCGNRSSQQR